MAERGRKAPRQTGNPKAGASRQYSELLDLVSQLRQANEEYASATMLMQRKEKAGKIEELFQRMLKIAASLGQKLSTEKLRVSGFSVGGGINGVGLPNASFNLQFQFTSSQK